MSTEKKESAIIKFENKNGEQTPIWVLQATV